MKLIDAIRTEDARTENGMTTNSTTLNHCVDLFFHIGAMRGQDKTKKINAFVKAFSEDALTALKVLFWARDIRGGAGERETFRQIVTHMVDKEADVLRKNLNLFAEYGRWDDLLVFVGTKLEADALEVIAAGLKDPNVRGLAAKWMPRPNVKNFTKKRQAKALRKYLNMSPKAYRQMLAELSNTVEQAMCSGNWESIDYSKIPSKAMSDYMKAFGRHDHAGFTKYLDSLAKGETKINASAVYPYDIVKNLNYGNANGADAQWVALPNYMEKSDERVLPLVDVSGSMGVSAGGSATVTCMDVAISLGMYISERNLGAFQDAFITFSSNPRLEVLKGSLSQRYNQLKRADWGQSTSLEKAYKLILDKAVANNVPANEMPTMLMVLSDMQFNEATVSRGGGWRGGEAVNWNPTAQKMVETMYADAGYEMPKIVYWNLRSVNSDSPVQFDKSGTALVSGFSPALLTNLLSGGAVTPFTMMMDVIGSERYAPVTI
jgi:hypothetical protein